MALYCYDIGRQASHTLISKTVVDANLANIASLELHHGLLTMNCIRVIEERALVTNALRRLSLDAWYGLKETEEQLALQQTLRKIIRRPTNNNLRAILLHADFDCFELLLHRQAEVRSLHIKSTGTYELSESASSPRWTLLDSLSVYLGERVYCPTGDNLVRSLLRCQLPALRKLSIAYDERVQPALIVALLLHTAPTVEQLSVYLHGLYMVPVQIPSSSTLRAVHCECRHAKRLLQSTYASLQSVRLDGFRRPFEDGRQCPGLPLSRKLDVFMWFLFKNPNFPSMETVQLNYEFADVFASQPNDLYEIAVYSYWGTILPTANMKFIDNEEKPILPKTWNLALERTPPIEDGWD